MIENHRPSILHRPRRTSNPHNVENMESEYSRSQEKQRSKTARLAEAEERLRRASYASPAELLQDQGAMRGALEQQMQDKANQGRVYKMREADCFPANHTPRQPEDISRPWTSTTQFMSASQEADARYRVDAQAAEVNRDLYITRARESWISQEAERVATDRSQKAEDGFFNYGAASNQWIPREQRVRPASAHARAHAARPAPYAWENTLPIQTGSKKVLPPSAGPRPPYAVCTGVHATPSTARGGGPLMPQENLPQRNPTRSSAPTLASCPPYSLHVEPAPVTQPRTVAPAREYPWSWHA